MALHAHALRLPETGTDAPALILVDPIALRPAAMEELLDAAGGLLVLAAGYAAAQALVRVGVVGQVCEPPGAIGRRAGRLRVEVAAPEHAGVDA